MFIDLGIISMAGANKPAVLELFTVCWLLKGLGKSAHDEKTCGSVMFSSQHGYSKLKDMKYELCIIWNI